jgi:hypothetical protein
MKFRRKLWLKWTAPQGLPINIYLFFLFFSTNFQLRIFKNKLKLIILFSNSIFSYYYFMNIDFYMDFEFRKKIRKSLEDIKFGGVRKKKSLGWLISVSNRNHQYLNTKSREFLYKKFNITKPYKMLKKLQFDIRDAPNRFRSRSNNILTTFEKRIEMNCYYCWDIIRAEENINGDKITICKNIILRGQFTPKYNQFGEIEYQNENNRIKLGLIPIRDSEEGTIIKMEIGKLPEMRYPPKFSWKELDNLIENKLWKTNTKKESFNDIYNGGNSKVRDKILGFIKKYDNNADFNSYFYYSNKEKTTRIRRIIKKRSGDYELNPLIFRLYLSGNGRLIEFQELTPDFNKFIHKNKPKPMSIFTQDDISLLLNVFRPNHNILLHNPIGTINPANINIHVNILTPATWCDLTGMKPHLIKNKSIIGGYNTDIDIIKGCPRFHEILDKIGADVRYTLIDFHKKKKFDFSISGEIQRVFDLMLYKGTLKIKARYFLNEDIEYIKIKNEIFYNLNDVLPLYIPEILLDSNKFDIDGKISIKYRRKVPIREEALNIYKKSIIPYSEWMFKSQSMGILKYNRIFKWNSNILLPKSIDRFYGIDRINKNFLLTLYKNLYLFDYYLDLENAPLIVMQNLEKRNLIKEIIIKNQKEFKKIRSLIKILELNGYKENFEEPKYFVTILEHIIRIKNDALKIYNQTQELKVIRQMFFPFKSKASIQKKFFSKNNFWFKGPILPEIYDLLSKKIKNLIFLINPNSGIKNQYILHFLSLKTPINRNSLKSLENDIIQDLQEKNILLK